jgi:hypothetical protein
MISKSSQSFSVWLGRLASIPIKKYHSRNRRPFKVSVETGMCSNFHVEFTNKESSPEIVCFFFVMYLCL